MKKFVLASLVSACALISQAAFADATTICARQTAAHAGTAPANGTAGTHYMVTGMTPKCSANVYLLGIDGDQGAWYTVAANSNKGANTFGASTGGFNLTTPCPTNCTDQNVTDMRDSSNRGT